MKQFYKSLIAIALPVSFQSLIQSSLGMIDQLMIGRLGENSIAAVGLGGKGMFILLFVLSGIGGGASVYIAQYWGKGEKDKIARVISVTLLSGGIITALFFLFSSLSPSLFIGLFTGDEQVIAGGVAYLRFVAPGYFPLLVSVVWASALRSTGNTKLPMYAGLASVFANTALNYIFIFGKLGIPPLGVEGAALATTVSRFVEAAVLLIVVYRGKLPGAVRLSEMRTLPSPFLRSFAATTVPLVLTEFIWVLGDSAFSAIYGRIGTDELAAMTLSGPVQMITIGLMTGLSTAAAVILGGELGGGNRERAGQYAGKFLIISTVATALLGIAVIALAPLYVSAFPLSPAVADLTGKVLSLFGLFLWVKVANMIMGNGILRSGGDTRFVMIMDTMGMWVLGVPLGIVSAFLLKLPFPLVYLAVSLEEIVRMALMFIRTKRGRWLNNLVSEI